MRVRDGTVVCVWLPPCACHRSRAIGGRSFSGSASCRGGVGARVRTRPIPAHRLVEAVRTPRVDLPIVVAVGPLDVGAEAAAAAEVDGRVHAEAGLRGHRIYEAAER